MQEFYCVCTTNMCNNEFYAFRSLDNAVNFLANQYDMNDEERRVFVQQLYEDFTLRNEEYKCYEDWEIYVAGFED